MSHLCPISGMNALYLIILIFLIIFLINLNLSIFQKWESYWNNDTRKHLKTELYM